MWPCICPECSRDRAEGGSCEGWRQAVLQRPRRPDGPPPPLCVPPHTGQYVSQPMAGDPGVVACRPCQPGTFSPYASEETSCLPCALCRKGKWAAVRPACPPGLGQGTIPRHVGADEQGDELPEQPSRRAGFWQDGVLMGSRLRRQVASVSVLPCVRGIYRQTCFRTSVCWRQVVFGPVT